MADIDIRPAVLRQAGSNCEATVAVQVDVAEREFANAEGEPEAARMADMVSMSAANACITAYHDAFRDGSKVFHGLSTTLQDTAAVVVDEDSNAANLFRGPVPQLPTIDLGDEG